MKLYYFAKSSNFGDDLNSWLWHRLLPHQWDPDDDICFSGIGTIINANMPASSRWIVFTSGVGYGGPPLHFGDERWNVVSVRGPLSAAVLGLPPSAAVADGALLLAALPEYAPLPAQMRQGVVFVPHFEAETAAAWPDACRRAGIEYLSPLNDSREVVERIRHARLVIAEAMHAAIVADAMRVPWVPVTSSPQVSTFKWLDWTGSMELPYAPSFLPPSTTLSRLRNAMLWAYDQSHRFSDRGNGFALAYFRRRYAGKRGRAAVNKWGRRMHRRVERLLTSPRASAWRARHDDSMIDRAAADLSRIAQDPGILSDDRVFRDRLEVLTTRLAGLR